MAVETATATILVTDLVGSTELRVALGEERADGLRREVDARQAEAVAAHGGTLVKGLGDGVLALFTGAAEAVAAAVAVQQAAHTVGQRAGAPVQLRVGVSAGDVSLEDGDCFGTPVVEAARLCAQARGDQILVADVVRVLARGRGGHVFDREGTLTLKGLADPVDAWSVVWTPVTEGTGLRQGSPYVGREHERATARELLERVRAGHGATLLIAGEPGIGKSRFVTELCQESPDVQLLWGGCHDGDVIPVAAFAEAVTEWARHTDRELVATAAGTDAAVLAGLAPALREVLPDLLPASAIPPDEAAVRLQDSLCQWLDRLAAVAPVVFVLDDLHWADDTTIRLLRGIARSARSRRVLVVGTYRETDLGRSHPLADALPLLRREVEPTKIALDGLDATEVGDLLRLMAGHDVPAAFAELLADQCNGNPFFIRETLLHLWEEGRIAQQDGTWVATTQELGIPEGVREVLGRRLARLSPVANRLLAIGALFEVAFPLPVVCDVTDIDENEALDAIDEALTAQIVRPSGQFDTYAFTHALFRHTLVSELNPSRQVRAHRAVAEALEKRIRGVPTPAQAALLARHFWRSAALPGGERGVPYALQAAAHAEESTAFREAYDLFVIARDLLEPGDERERSVQDDVARCAVLAQLPTEDVVAEAERLGEIIASTSGPDEAADAVSLLCKISATLDEVTSTWRIAAVGRRYLRPERRDDTWCRLRTLELNERDATDPDGIGLSLDTPERRELFEYSWPRPRSLESGFLMGLPGREGIRPWLAIPQPRPAEAMLLWWLDEDVPAFVEACGDVVTESLRTGRLAQAVGFTAIRARGLLALNEHDEADRALQEGFALVGRISERSDATFQLFACIAFAGWARGAPVALAEVGIGDERITDPNTRWAGIAIQGGRAYTSAWFGDAGESMGEVAAILPAIEGAAGWAPNYPLIVHFAVGVHWWLERTDHLDVLRSNLERKVIAPDQRYLEANPHWAGGRLASLQGRVDDARASLDRAVAELTSNGAVGLLPAVHLDAAIVEQRAGSAGSPGRFDAAIAAGRSRSKHPAMSAWIDRFDALERDRGNLGER